MADPLAVVFDCDGVLASNGSSWQSIHENFGTENKEMFSRFVKGRSMMTSSWQMMCRNGCKRRGGYTRMMSQGATRG